MGEVSPPNRNKIETKDKKKENEGQYCHPERSEPTVDARRG